MAWRRDLLPNVEQCEERGDRLDFQYELFSHNNIRLETHGEGCSHGLRLVHGTERSDPGDRLGMALRRFVTSQLPPLFRLPISHNHTSRRKY